MACELLGAYIEDSDCGFLFKQLSHLYCFVFIFHPHVYELYVLPILKPKSKGTQKLGDFDGVLLDRGDHQSSGWGHYRCRKFSSGDWALASTLHLDLLLCGQV